MKAILLAISKGKNRFFRVNVGHAWVGNQVIKINKSQIMRVDRGDVVVKSARPFKTGVPKGFSDIIGFTNKTITTEMVGDKVAIFTALEVKLEKGRPTSEQINFLKRVKDAGGISGITRCVDDAVDLTDD